ncbi:SpoIIE family protein phosphatase [Streptomyces sp. NRRL S-337]|uniref:SpoIIE family protein phosphatase n=1 Tax=Streptomyces sp. NRRL S-337 TaxID=1463900 RepID=UPI0004CBF8DA|nr:SpoIIE family protein phosphatase [Streptomyces sp. NRRL S-337]
MGRPVTTFSQSPEDPFALHRAACAVVDHGGTLVGWGPGAEELLGYRSNEAIGRPALDFLVKPDGVPTTGELLAERVRAGAWSGLLTARHRDGHPVDLGLRASMVVRDGVCEWFLVGAPAEDVAQWERDRAILDGLFRRSPVGIVVHSPDLRVLRVNRAVERISEMSTDEHRGRSTGELLVAQDAETDRKRVRSVLESGKPLISTEQSLRLRSDPGRERVVSVSAFRLEDSAGHVLGVTEMIEDITGRYRARRRLALLNEASARIGTTLDVSRTACELAEVAVPSLADYASVDLLQAVPGGDEPAQGVTGPLVRIAARGVSREGLEVTFPEGAPVTFAPRSPQGRCLAGQQPLLEPVVTLSPEWYDMAPQQGRRALDLGIHSLVVVPLVARGLVLGVVSLWRSQRPEPFEEDDLTLAEELAARAAVCLDNARRYTQQQRTALALQRSLLPGTVPDLPAVEVAHRYLPANVGPGLGGDWFDVIPLSGARVALVVGDVVGHGIHATATMGRLRTAVHTLAGLDLEPDEVLSRLDDLVNLIAAEQEVSGKDPSAGAPVTGATCLYAVYDPVSRQCSMARAGHLPPAVVTPDGTVDLLELPAGPPLGLGGLPFESREVELPEGSLLALYTDGLVQERKRNGAPTDIEDGLALLRQTLTGPTTSLEHTCQAVVDRLVPGHHPTDDVALLIARTRVLPPRRVASWGLPVDVTAASQARELITAKLTEWGLDTLVFTTELIASELVTNAYRYASGPVTLRLIREQCLICEVADSSHTSPHLRRARSTDEGGRGLFLVAQLTERWGTRYTREGKTVWTEQPLPADSRR